MKRSKAYRQAAELLEEGKIYSPLEAATLAKQASPTKFDGTVEVAMRLGVDPRKADQMVRGTVSLPHGTGKTVRVIVFATGEKAEEAIAAGADKVGSDDLIAEIQGGYLDFDAAIATPDQMAKVGRIARVLGPRGLMPNPKTGTVTPDVGKAVADINRRPRSTSRCVQVRTTCHMYQTGKVSTEVVGENCELVDNITVGGLQTNCLVIGKAR